MTDKLIPNARRDDFEQNDAYYKLIEALSSKIGTEITRTITKTKSSYRTLPLVAPFEAILKRMKTEQEENRKLCGNCYCQDYLGYIYVNELGELIKPGYLSSHVPAVLKEHNMPPIRFHDLRHPYVKHTTKKYFLQKQKSQTIKHTAMVWDSGFFNY